MSVRKNVDCYLSLNWTYKIERESHEGKSYYVIRVNELPGVCTDAASVEEGMKNIKEAIEAALTFYIKNQEPVPVPKC